MTSIRFSDFGPPYSWPILRQLSSAFGWPNECSVDGEADDDDDGGDEDVSSYLPLLDEFLAWRDNAPARDPPKPPRPPSPLPTKVGQTAQHCRLIHGLCFEGGEEISLDYLGPTHVNGYDSESDSLEPTDDSSGNDGQAGWSIYQHGEHEPENNRTTEAAAGTRCDRKTAVRNEDRSGDGTSSTAFESQVVAGAGEQPGGEESSPDARPIETISSATRRAARCFLFVVEDVQSKVKRVRSAIASLFSRNRGIPAEATAVVEEPEASVYEFACELNGGEHEAAILPTQSEPEDDRALKVKIVREQCDEETPLHSLLEGCSNYDDRKYGGACSTEASSPAAAKAGRRLNDALKTQETQFNDLRITEATMPQHHASASQPSGRCFDSLCVTVASSPEIRDSSVEPSHEVELNITDGGPSNEVIVGNATDDVEILDDEPQEGDTMNIVVAAENCCQTTLSLPVPLQVGGSHEEVCAQAQSDASENDVPRNTTPVTDKRIESREFNCPLENNACSDLQLIESPRVAPQHSDKNVSEASVFESPFPETAAKATPQNSQDDQPPEESPPQTITRLPSDIIECINTLSSLPIWDFCPPSHTTSAASRPSPQLSLTSRSEGEIRSDDEPDGILPSNLLAEEGAPGGGNADHEYEPETFPPSTPISAITLSEGEIVDSDSDQSIAFPALNEAEKFGFKDPAKTSKSSTSCTRTYTDDEGTTSSDSSSSSTRSSSSSSSTQTSSDSESDTESRLSSSLSESPQREIQEAKTAKAAMIREKKAVNNEYAAEAAGRSELCYTQHSPSGTNLPARHDDQDNGSLSTSASALVLKDHKKDDAEDDADILIPLLLNTTFNTEDVAEAAAF
ncbi:serine-rich adhesin for platelets-like [Rhipicephalus sanguineus]|uniref:serine-rich adhesin for platelets-like n=1 Tax=Rhipicephalus sanguineus TaxID=34632 RepID=UPI0018934BE3|nr:serine-rich adhesin for platelets-like [Rhipicephalus sanguineus]